MKFLGKTLLFWLLKKRAKKILSAAKSIIGITGSVGKTSTRMALASVLSIAKTVQTSPQNFNTPLGLALAINEIESCEKSLFFWTSVLWKILANPLPKPEIIILEFGVDSPGDMDQLLKLVQPDTVVFTPIGRVHMNMGQFPSLEAIRTEKGKLAHGAKKIFASSADSDMQHFLQKQYPHIHQVFFGSNPSAQELIQDIEEHKKEIRFFFQGAQYSAPVLGAFQAQIFAPAIVIGKDFGMNAAAIQRGLSAFDPPPGRGRILLGKKNTHIWDFSYNSSPLAVEAVLEALKNQKEYPRKIALLGSLNELGPFSEEEHYRLGKKASESADVLLFVGDFADAFQQGVAKQKPCWIFSHPHAAGTVLHSLIQPGDLIMAKGSQNGVFLEEALIMILKNPEDHTRLCRQDSLWKTKKKEFFKKLSPLQ